MERDRPVERVILDTELKKFSFEDIYRLQDLGNIIYVASAKSVTQMLKEDGSSSEEYFGGVNPYRPLRDFLPIPTEVAVNPNQLAIPSSNNIKFEDQLDLIKEINLSLKEQGISHAEAIIPDVSTLCQLDIKHQKETGEKLIVGFYACTTTETSGGGVSAIGRLNPNGKLVVVSHSRNRGNRNVWVFPVIVPILK